MACPCPSFGAIGYAFTLLVPVLAAMAMIFWASLARSRPRHRLAAGLVFLSLVRIRRAGLDEP